MNTKKLDKDSTKIQLAKANEILNSVISELGDLYDKIGIGKFNGGELHQVITDLYAVSNELNSARDVEPEFVDPEHFYNSEKANEEGWSIYHDGNHYYPVANDWYRDTSPSVSFNMFVTAYKSMDARDLSNNNVRAIRFLKEFSPCYVNRVIEDAKEHFSELVSDFPELLGE